MFPHALPTTTHQDGVKDDSAASETWASTMTSAKEPGSRRRAVPVWLTLLLTAFTLFSVLTIIISSDLQQYSPSPAQASLEHGPLVGGYPERFPDIPSSPVNWSDRLLALKQESNEDGTLQIPTPSRLFNRTEFTTIVEERRWWQARMDHHQTAFITSANTATFPYIENLICSLAAISPSLLEKLVVWALDEEAAGKLMGLGERISNGEFGGGQWRAPIGVYYDAAKTGTKEFTSGKVNSGLYFGIVDLRREFYVHLLDTIGINFVFTDADTFFSADPFEDLNLPFGVSDVEGRTGVSHQKPKTVKDYYKDFPDLIYSTDARKPYRHLKDPYEGQTRIPKVCGGFFFARSNTRTVKMYRRILENRMNDQWGVDDLLNNHLPAVLVDPLPAGLTKRQGDVKVGEGDPLRVRILSQAAYSNALGEWAKPGSRGPGFEKLVSELKSRGEKEVLYHPNFWIDEKDPGNRIFIFTDNKTWIFDQLGMWKMRDGRCVFPNIPKL
ncbi:hypothetical protein HDU67_008408 [Dinochytrium kinnereticum]|nr:hypothetical protein HDU67_008408 [Dinochytrium kinnereticum]